MSEQPSMSRRQLTVTLPPLFPAQQAIAKSPARYRIVSAGRRFGKSRLGALLCIVTALDGGRAWWVAPSHPQAGAAWRELRQLATQIPGKQIREADRRITMPGGGEVAIRSGEAPDSLRGEGLDFLVLDEAAYIAPEVWDEALRPALTDRKGKALLISTPAGYNWFYDAWLRGQEGRSDWQSWQYPTIANPIIDPAEVEAARATLPERVFNQEFLGTFEDNAGAVFRNVRACATAQQQLAAAPGHQYVFGVDWARTIDATAIAVVDVTIKELVALDRFTGVEYAQQVGRLRALAARFRPTAIIAEVNSMGGPLAEQLLREGLPVQPFTTTNATKAAIVDGLALAFERHTIQILDDPILLAELAGYAMERLPSGLIRYAARVGHDDTVMALCLAWYGAGVEPATGFVYRYDTRYQPAAAAPEATILRIGKDVPKERPRDRRPWVQALDRKKGYE